MKKILLLLVPLALLISLKAAYETTLQDRNSEYSSNLLDTEGDDIDSTVDTADGESLKIRIEEKKEELRDMILALPEAIKYIKRIKVHQKKIDSIEEGAGIKALQEQIADLRQKSCKIQQSDPEIKKYLERIDRLSRQIKKATGPQQKEIQQLMNSKDLDAQFIKEKLGKLHKEVQRKTRKQQREIEALNKKIRDRMSSQIDEAKAPAKELKEKYDAVNKQIKPIIAKLKKEVNALKTLINKDEDIGDAREEYQKLRQKLQKAEPCVGLALAQQSWEDLVF